MERSRPVSSLVIGGTGMLAEATRWMCRHHPPTLLVARRASAFAGGAPDLVALDLDWLRSDFAPRIAEAVGTPSRVVKALIWLHEPVRLLGRLSPLLPPAGTVIVLGSMGGRPAVPVGADHAAIVRLGSKPTPGGRRWLTHAEISAGAIAALRDGRSRIVGDLAPAG